MEIKTLELNKKKLEQDQKQWEAEQELKKQQLEEEKRQFNEQMALQKAKASSSGGLGGGNPQPRAALDNNEPDDEPPVKVEPTKDNRAQLGLGPLTDKTLAGLVNSGRVTYTQSGDTVYYRWSAKSQKEQQLLAAQGVLDKYTMRY